MDVDGGHMESTNQQGGNKVDSSSELVLQKNADPDPER